jgi:hypothetical protein
MLSFGVGFVKAPPPSDPRRSREDSCDHSW